MAKKQYRSYEDARKRGSHDVWPGCGSIGRCMPCGRLHNFDYRSHVNGPIVDDFRCVRNHHDGCPRPKPEPKHDWGPRTCRRCGRERGWIAPDRMQYRSLMAAKRHGWNRKQLEREA